MNEPEPDPSPAARLRAGLVARVRAELAERLDALVAATRRVRAGDDPEALHDTRVAARRLGEELALWAAAFDAEALDRARRAVRRLRRRLGPPREAEVHRAQFEALLPTLDPLTRLAGASLHAALERRTSRGRRRAARRARIARVERLAERVEALWEEAGDPAIDVLAAARAHVARRDGALAHALARAAGSEDEEVLHELRLAIKRARYAALGLSAATDPADASPSPRSAALRRLQQVLGVAHDRATLAAWVGARQQRDADRGRALSPRPPAPLLARIDDDRRAALRALPERLAVLAAASPAIPPGRPERADR